MSEPSEVRLVIERAGGRDNPWLLAGATEADREFLRSLGFHPSTPIHVDGPAFLRLAMLASNRRVSVVIDYREGGPP